MRVTRHTAHAGRVNCLGTSRRIDGSEHRDLACGTGDLAGHTMLVAEERELYAKY